MSYGFTTYRPELLRIPLPSPAREDVIIRSAHDCPTDYVLARDHQPAQIRYSAYATALIIAKRWAVRQHIDVWFQGCENEFILLSRHRADRFGVHHLVV